MRVERPLPSINGWETFISMYFDMIWSSVSSGIDSIFRSSYGRYSSCFARLLCCHYM